MPERNTNHAESRPDGGARRDARAQLLARGSDAARQRFHHLRRLLFVADMLTGVISGALVGVVARGSSVAGRCCWPPSSRSPGPSPRSCADSTRREDLRAWASGVSEAPRLVLTCLAVSWPIYALLVAMGLARPAAGAFVGALGLRQRSPGSAAPAPASPSTAPRSCASAR